MFIAALFRFIMVSFMDNHPSFFTTRTSWDVGPYFSNWVKRYGRGVYDKLGE